MIALTCHCEKVRVEVNRLPAFINACNCTLCRKSGGRWGYYNASEVSVTGTTQNYCRTDLETPAVALHFCPHCGATTHWTLTQAYQAETGANRVGVNMALLPDAELAGIEMRFPDGLSWDGEGDYSYVRVSEVIGRQSQA